VSLAYLYMSNYNLPRATDLSIHTMHTALNPLMEHLDCEQCREALRDRIKDVVGQWASVGVSLDYSLEIRFCPCVGRFCGME